MTIIAWIETLKQVGGKSQETKLPSRVKGLQYYVLTSMLTTRDSQEQQMEFPFCHSLYLNFSAQSCCTARVSLRNILQKCHIVLP